MPASQSQVPELQSWVPGACPPLATAFVGSPAHPEALVAPVPSSGGPHRPVGSLQLLQGQAQQRTTGGEVDRYLCGTGGTSRVPGLAPVMTFSTPGRLSRPSLSDPILHHSFLQKHVSSLFHLHPFLLLCFFAVLPSKPLSFSGSLTAIDRDHPKIPKARHAASSTLASSNDQSHPTPAPVFHLPSWSLTGYLYLALPLLLYSWVLGRFTLSFLVAPCSFLRSLRGVSRNSASSSHPACWIPVVDLDVTQRERLPSSPWPSAS